MATSDILGNNAQAKKRPSVLNQSLADLTTVPEKPLGPVKQGTTPPRKPYPSGPAGTYDLGGLADDIRSVPGPRDVLRAAPAFVGTGLGQLYDMQRSGLILAAGGDPATAEGGPNKYAGVGREAGARLASGFGDLASLPGQAVLEATGARPRAPEPAQAKSAAPAAPVTAPADPEVATGSSASATDAAPRLDTYSAASVPGVAQRRGSDGVMEFTDKPSALADIGPPSAGGGSLSVVSGGREGMARNLLATEIMQQTRRENANPNYLTTVRDSGARGAQGTINAIANRRDAEKAAERAAGQRASVAGGNERIAGLEQGLQQVAAGRRAEESAARLDELQRRMVDPNLTPAERAAAERAYGVLTVDAKDRYIVQDSVLGQDSVGAPITGKVALDVLTGEIVGNGQQQGQSAYQEGAIYQRGDGKQAKYKGVDASGRAIWEEL